ncbi:receptor protein kinase-like protein At4g34220 [Oryza glaberrima]|uniref:receptor protein kinase-like protein At4g34220 n=1 Tax=Oryza glaberrima TaxID=4538 RepID=UPI00224C2EFF|nr:receptor protein kinase-like protein At4g34220 [Oryza glaberrima]
MLLLLFFALTLGHGARPAAPLPRRGTSLRAEVAALLHWKSTLKGFSQHQLGTWRHDIHPCNWTGITCGDVPWRQRRHGRTTARNAITGIALPGAHLVGGLDTLSFRSFPYLASLDLSDNGHLSAQPTILMRSIALEREHMVVYTKQNLKISKCLR